LQAPVRERVLEVRKDGSTYTTLSSLSLLKDQNGKPTGIIMLCRNVTDIVKDITNLRAASEEARNDVGL
jgi:PAS domain-containing protein